MSRIKARILLVSLFVVVVAVMMNYELLIDINTVLKAYVEHTQYDSAMGMLVFLVMQVLQVVLFFIPGEVIQAMGGFAFGAVTGIVLSTVGIALGSSLQYLISKKLGRLFIHRYGDKKSVRTFIRLLRSERNKLVLFLLYLLPGFPKDMLGYLSGISGISYVSFISITTVARLPGMIMSNLFGANLYDENHVILAYILVMAAILVYVSVMYQDRVIEYLKHMRKEQ